MKKLIALFTLFNISLSFAAPVSNGTVQKLQDLVRGGKSAQDIFNDVTKKNKLVVVKCSMKNCGPCKKVAPIIEKMAHTYKDNALFIELDVHLYDKVISKFNIKGAPSFIIFAQGNHIQTLRGSGKVNDIPKILDTQLRLIEPSAS